MKCYDLDNIEAVVSGAINIKPVLADNCSVVNIPASLTEVVLQAANTLRNIQYITVDYGPEKGVNEETSKADVTNYLYANDFSLISGSKYRQIGLFKNNRLLKH